MVLYDLAFVKWNVNHDTGELHLSERWLSETA